MTAANQRDAHLLCIVRDVWKGTQELKLVLENHLIGSRAKTPFSEIRDLFAQQTHSKGERGQADSS